MKKITMLLIVLLATTFLLAHEVSFEYSIAGTTTNDIEDEFAGWKLANASLTWGGNEFSDYEVTYSLNKYEITSAWKRFTLNENVNAIIGKKRYAFGRLEGSSCCATGAGSISIFSLDEPYVNWLAELEGTVFNIGWNLYIAHEDEKDADMGCRLSYEFSEVKLGAALLVRQIREADDGFVYYGFVDYEFDAEYTLADMFNFAFQATNLDDGIDDTEEQDGTFDLDIYAVAKYVPGFRIPVAGLTTPYVGYISKREKDESGNKLDALQESNIIMGLNFAPINGTYIKLEYNIDSVKGVEEKLDLQVGYIF